MDYASRITSGRQVRPMRNTIFGVEGIGKSTFAAMFPDAITMAAEDGTNHLDTSRMVPTSWADAIDFMAYLYNNEHPYKTLNVDTIGWLEELAATALCSKHEVESLEKIDKGFGKYKRYMVEEFSNMLRWCALLHGQGMHINFIGHVAVKRFQNPEDADYDRYQVAMIVNELAERIKQWSDNVLFFNYDTMIEKAKKDDMGKKDKAKSFNRRVIHTTRSAAFDAKNRMGLPDQLVFTTPPEEGFAEFWGYYQAWCQSATPSVVSTIASTN